MADLVQQWNSTDLYVYHYDPNHYQAHDEPDATHIHLYSYGEDDGIYRHDDYLIFGPAYVGDVYVHQQTIDTGPDSTASVISHEVGHALGLNDETSGHDTLMLSPNPGTRQSSASDRRTAEWCIPIFFVFPC